MFHALNRFKTLARRTAHTLQDWRRDTIARRELQSLDEFALRDIGLSHRAAAGHRGRTIVRR